MDKKVNIGGTNVFYRVEGNGDPVILIHGNGLSHGQWKYNMGPLSGSYKVYALDLPGFGLSDKPDIDYNVTYYVNILKAFMEAAGIESANIIGHSYGGAIAAGLAASHPEKVIKLILSDSTGISPLGSLYTKEVFNMILRLMVRSRRLYCRPMFYNSISSSMLDDTLLATDNKESQKAFLKNCREILRYDGDYINSLMSIRAPTLIIWGNDDMLLPVSDAEKYHGLIPRSSVMVIERCGHLPNVENFKKFNKTVLEFLSGKN